MHPNRLIVFLALLCTIGAANAATDIQFWHSMTGTRAQELDSLVKGFNASQNDVRVVATYKGRYGESLAAALEAHKKGESPHLLQVLEVGTATVMAAKGFTRPVAQVLEEGGVRFDARSMLPAVAGYFSDASGKLLAMPFNMATPVMYYNKDAFRKAKLDPAKPPKTWYEMVGTLGSLKDAGQACAFTTTYPSWVLVESMSAWHNQEFATHGNGLGGPEAKLAFNTKLMVRWISVLTSWHKAEYFTYSGRTDEGEKRFVAGECAILTASSSRQGDMRRAAKFDWEVAPLPHYDDFADAPHHTLIGGAGIWAMAGKKHDEYRAAARFLGHVVRPEVQAEWHQDTGYVPLTMAAYELTQKSGYYTKHPGVEIAVRQLLTRNPMKDSRGIRIGMFPEVRAIIEEELEQAWAGKKTPKDSLDHAVERGNELLRKFELANRGAQPAAQAAKPAKKAGKKADK